MRLEWNMNNTNDKYKCIKENIFYIRGSVYSTNIM